MPSLICQRVAWRSAWPKTTFINPFPWISAARGGCSTSKNPVLPDWVDAEAAGLGRLSLQEEARRSGIRQDARRTAGRTGQGAVLAAGHRRPGESACSRAATPRKGGAIQALMSYMNPRNARVVALTKPTETEKGNGISSATSRPSHPRRVREFLIAPGTTAPAWSRSWDFCTPEEYEHFLESTPRLEKLITGDGNPFFKFYIDIGGKLSSSLHDRRHSKLKCWETVADGHRRADQMGRLHRKARPHAQGGPTATMRPGRWCAATTSGGRGSTSSGSVLGALDYKGKDKKAIGEIDGQDPRRPKILK